MKIYIAIQRLPKKTGKPWWWRKWQELSTNALTSKLCPRASKDVGRHGKASQTGPCHGPTYGRSPKLGSASWSEQPMTPCLVPETSTNGLGPKRHVPFVTPATQASSTSCLAAQRHCHKAAIGGDMTKFWRSWQRCQSHAERRRIVDLPLKDGMPSSSRGLERASDPPARETQQWSSHWEVSGPWGSTWEGSSSSPGKKWKHPCGPTS